MRIAFYAPLKPVDHPVPSGDRLMARAFKALLEGLGHEVEIASTLRSYDRVGDRELQLASRERARLEVQRILAGVACGPAPELWFTYHAYHKAPDWLGPEVSRALAIPYVIAEASIAGKQSGGRWDLGHRATITAVDRADAVLALTRIDARNLARHMTDPAKLILFPPFLETLPDAAAGRDVARRRLAAALALSPETVWLVTVAMMRRDIKLDSYRLLAEALRGVAVPHWHLIVLGDGDAGAEVRRLIEQVAGNRVRFLGERSRAEVAEVCRAGDIFVWPALQEAYGMAILEALAAGLPVVACDEGGVADLVEQGCNGLLAPDRSAAALAAHLHRLIGDETLRRQMGRRAAARVAGRHSRAAAEDRLRAVLAGLADRAPRPSCT